MKNKFYSKRKSEDSDINQVSTFIDKCLIGMCLGTVEKLDEEIKLWSLSSTEITLQDWLGLTDDEFELLKSVQTEEKNTCFKEILVNRILDKL